MFNDMNIVQILLDLMWQTVTNLNNKYFPANAKRCEPYQKPCAFTIILYNILENRFVLHWLKQYSFNDITFKV